MSTRDTQIYRQDAAASGALLSVDEREALLRKYLPARDDEPVPPSISSSGSGPARHGARSTPRRRKPIRSFLKTQFYFFVFAIIQLVFGIYIRARKGVRAVKALILRVIYHHHRTPELIENDVAGLSRLPKHLSVILELPERAASGGSRRALRKKMRNRRKRLGQGLEHDALYGLGYQGLSIELESLLDDVSELAAWSSAAGIPVLSIYERRGVLKEMIPGVHAAVHARLDSYFGERRAPSLQVRAPHVPSYLNGEDEDEGGSRQGHVRAQDLERFHGGAEDETEKHFEYDSPTGEDDDEDGRETRGHLDLLLLSEDDGRATMVDLTKTLAEMSQKGKLSPRDVGLELIEQELTESFSAGDPDFLMLFGDRVVLQGYPPWQLRLTEMFCAGDGSSGTVDYPTWLKGLYRFAKAEMRFGR